MLILNLFLIPLCLLLHVIPLVIAVIKGANILLVAPVPVAVFSLVVVRMVQFLNCRVALLAHDALRTQLPRQLGPHALSRSRLLLRHRLAVLRRILEDLGRPPEIPHMVRINTAFGVVRVFQIGAPARLIVVHVEDEGFLFGFQLFEVQVEQGRLKQAVQHKVVFYFATNQHLVHLLDLPEHAHIETRQVVRRLIAIECHYERPVKSVLAVQLQLHRVVVPLNGFQVAFHKKDLYQQIAVLLSLILLLLVELALVGRSIEAERGKLFAGMQVLRKDLIGEIPAPLKNLLQILLPLLLLYIKLINLLRLARRLALVLLVAARDDHYRDEGFALILDHFVKRLPHTSMIAPRPSLKATIALLIEKRHGLIAWQ